MKAACLIVFVIQAIACGQVSSNGKVESTAGSQVQKDSCDNPDADINCSFIHMPSSLNNVLTIAGKNESGERMVISGKVFKSDGKTPYSNVILYAYQTDSEGYYSKSGKEQGAQKWHGRLHAWCKTDRYGKYQIQASDLRLIRATLCRHIFIWQLKNRRTSHLITSRILCLRMTLW